MRSIDGAVLRALASHQCGPGSIVRLIVICGLSLLLVLVPALRGLSLDTLAFPSPQKEAFPNSNSIWITVKHFIMSLWLRRLHKHLPCFCHELIYFLNDFPHLYACTYMLLCYGIRSQLGFDY